MLAARKSRLAARQTLEPSSENPFATKPQAGFAGLAGAGAARHHWPRCAGGVLCFFTFCKMARASGRS